MTASFSVDWNFWEFLVEKKQNFSTRFHVYKLLSSFVLNHNVLVCWWFPSLFYRIQNLSLTLCLFDIDVVLYGLLTLSFILRCSDWILRFDKINLLFLFLFFLSSIYCISKLPYTQVYDPYRWLEDPDSVECQEFVEAHNKITQPYLEGCDQWKNINEKLTKLWNYPKFTIPARHGDFYYYYMNTGLQNQKSVESLSFGKQF